MKGKAWASWLMAGLLAFGSVPVTAANPVATGKTPSPASAPIASSAIPAASAPSKTSTQAGVLVLTRELARKEILALPAVTQASRKAQKAYEDWQNAVAVAKDLDTEKMTFTNPWNGETEKIVYEDLVQMRLRIQKFWLPDQMGFLSKVASKTTDLTILNLENGMDGMMLGLVAAQDEVNAKTRSRDLAVNALTRMKASKAAGNVTQLDVDGATLDLEKAGMALMAAKRSLENQRRSFNRFLGAPLDRIFTVSLPPSGSMPFLQTDDYVAQALQNRFELFSLREQIALKEKNLELLTFKDQNKIDTDVKAEYVSGQRDLEKLRLDLTTAIRDITIEMRAASLSISMANLDAKTALRAIEAQKEQLATQKAQIAAGRQPYWTDDALDASVAATEAGFATARLSLDMKVRQFRQAAQIGPAVSAN